jgi:hypothetical protein
MTALLWLFRFVGNNNPYLDLHVKFLTFLSNRSQILSSVTDFNESLQYKTQKYAQGI